MHPAQLPARRAALTKRLITLAPTEVTVRREGVELPGRLTVHIKALRGAAEGRQGAASGTTDGDHRVVAEAGTDFKRGDLLTDVATGAVYRLTYVPPIKVGQVSADAVAEQ